MAFFGRCLPASRQVPAAEVPRSNSRLCSSGSPTAAASPITRKVSAPSFGALNGGSYQREELGSPAGAQPPFATGSPTSVQRKPLPSFRMKAFKNQRQTTFHSLDMHTDRTAEAQVRGRPQVATIFSAAVAALRKTGSFLYQSPVTQGILSLEGCILLACPIGP